MVRDQNIPVRVSQNQVERSPFKETMPQGLLRNLNNNNFYENNTFQ